MQNTQIYERLFTSLHKANGRGGQTELASHLGISVKTIATWKVRGSDPPAKYIPSIADFLGVSVEWLLTGDEPKIGTVGKQKGQNLTPEEELLLRVYASVDVKKRSRLINLAIELEESG